MQPADPDVTTRYPELSGHRARPPWPVVVVAVVVVAGLAVGGMALWGGDDETVRSERLPMVTTTVLPTETTAGPVATAAPAPATTGAPATTRPQTTSTSATTVATRRLADSRVSLDGIGPVDIGMTREQAGAAAGTTIRMLRGPAPEDVCAFGQPEDGPEGLLFMFVNGRIARVDVGAVAATPSPVKTVSGVGTGSTEAEVQRTYPGRITVSGHPYVPTGHYLTYTPADPSLKHLSMIFETDGQRVTSYRAGLIGAVSQIEGCA